MARLKIQIYSLKTLPVSRTNLKALILYNLLKALSNDFYGRKKGIFVLSKIP